MTEVKNPATMTDKEILAWMQADDPINAARKVFNAECGRLEQAGMQRRNPSVFDIRRMEFEAVIKIAAALNRAHRVTDNTHNQSHSPDIAFLRKEGTASPDACVQERAWCARMNAIADNIEYLEGLLFLIAAGPEEKTRSTATAWLADQFTFKVKP